MSLQEDRTSQQTSPGPHAAFIKPDMFWQNEMGTQMLTQILGQCMFSAVPSERLQEVLGQLFTLSWLRFHGNVNFQDFQFCGRPTPFAEEKNPRDKRSHRQASSWS